VWQDDRKARDQDGFEQIPDQNEKMKATPEAMAMAAAYIELFIEEAVNRCILLAEAEGDESLDLSHVERILPQLLLDF